MKYLSLLTLPNPNPSATPITVIAPPGVPDASVITNIPQFIITTLIIGVIVLALAFIIISGIQWITSGGDAKKIEGARGRLTYAIIGLVIALAAFAIVSFTIQLLGGDPTLFNIGITNESSIQQQFDNRGQHGNTDTTPAPTVCPIVLGVPRCR